MHFIFGFRLILLDCVFWGISLFHYEWTTRVNTRVDHVWNVSSRSSFILGELKPGKNMMYTFAIWTIIVNVYIILLPDFNSEYLYYIFINTCLFWKNYFLQRLWRQYCNRVFNQECDKVLSRDENIHKMSTSTWLWNVQLSQCSCHQVSFTTSVKFDLSVLVIWSSFEFV